MYSMERTITYSSIGSDGRLRNSAIVDLLQDASLFHLETHPVMSPFFEAENCIMFLVSRQIDIVRLPEYGERVTVKTWTYELKRMYGYRNTMIYSQSGEVLVSSNACGAFMDAATARPRKAPAELCEKVKLYPKAEMEYTPRKIALPECEPEVFEPAPILRHYIDMNDHVNNARYIDIADEYLPKGAQVERMRIEYKTPVKLGEVVIPKVYRQGNIITVELCLDGKCCTVIEYTLKNL